MPSLLCIAGPPGAGKSTVSALVSARLSPSVLVRGDELFRFLDQGKVAPWRPEATEQNRVVIRASGAAAGQYVSGGYETVFDGVLGPWWLPTFLEASGLDELHYAVLLPTADRCVRNVAAREGRVDEAAARQVHDEVVRTLVDVDERHVLRDPPGGPEETAAEVLARFGEGALSFRTRSGDGATGPG